MREPIAPRPSTEISDITHLSRLFSAKLNTKALAGDWINSIPEPATRHWLDYCRETDRLGPNDPVRMIALMLTYQ